MQEDMELERELADLEASDKELAERNPKRLLDFLIMVEAYAWGNGLKKLTLYCSNQDVKFKVEGRRVYREIHKEGSCYKEEHLKISSYAPLYTLEIRDNREKVPSLAPK